MVNNLNNNFYFKVLASTQMLEIILRNQGVV